MKDLKALKDRILIIGMTLVLLGSSSIVIAAFLFDKGIGLLTIGVLALWLGLFLTRAMT